MQTSMHAARPSHSSPHDTPQTQRAHAEYVEMPGLNLTSPQAARLFGVSVGDATALLSEMVGPIWLRRSCHCRLIHSARP